MFPPERRECERMGQKRNSLSGFLCVHLIHLQVSKFYGLEVDNCYNSIRYKGTILHFLFTEGHERRKERDLWTRSKKTGREERRRKSENVFPLNCYIYSMGQFSSQIRRTTIKDVHSKGNLEAGSGQPRLSRIQAYLVADPMVTDWTAIHLDSPSFFPFDK